MLYIVQKVDIMTGLAVSEAEKIVGVPLPLLQDIFSTHFTQKSLHGDAGADDHPPITASSSVVIREEAADSLNPDQQEAHLSPSSSSDVTDCFTRCLKVFQLVFNLAFMLYWWFTTSMAFPYISGCPHLITTSHLPLSKAPKLVSQCTTHLNLL